MPPANSINNYMKKLIQQIVFIISFGFPIESTAQSFIFNVSMKNPASHYFNVEMLCNDMQPGIIDFKIPVWTPGYYQFLNFHENVENLAIQDDKGNVIEYAKNQPNSWRIRTKEKASFRITYDIKTIRPFVATPYLDTSRGYISPPGVFLHIAGHLNKPVQVNISPFPGWNRVATGLDSVEGKQFTYHAGNFDILYDSPILIGKLEELRSFKVEDKLHRMIGFTPGEFNRDQLMEDLEKIVKASAAIIGDIPYKQYTFIPLGPGGGGIEHLNSTSFSFNGKGLSDPKSRIEILHFLAHEYFHHYNVKRIRPIELGPFDYDKGSRTKMLWVSEGLTVYYEYLVVRRAGISTEEDVLNALRTNILAYENKPGRHFQSLAQSSYETWSDGPFGRTGDEVNKTISYYQKGPVVGWLLDLAIRNSTQNKKSLDDVMRMLYKKYYKEKNRGFTEAEFRLETENIAGKKLNEIFDYVYTTNELNYNKYLNYAGLQVDTTHKVIEGAWLGANTRLRNDSLIVSSVDYESPAYKAGIKTGSIILSVNGKPHPKLLKSVSLDYEPLARLAISVIQNGGQKTFEIVTGTKSEQGFEITKVPKPDALQTQIYQSWIGGNK